MESVKEPEVESVCKKHKRALDVFCQVDQIPICMVCHLSQYHEEHCVLPIDEAAEAYRDQIQSCMKILKKEIDEIQSFKLSGEKKSQELMKQLETERQKIMSEFEQLFKFLKEQERLLLAQLEEVNKEIEKRRDEYVAKLSEELSSVSSLISEMEQKCQQPTSKFLQDIKDTLRRCEREKFHNPAFPFDLKWESSQETEFLEDIMKTFKDTLSSRLPFHKADVTLDPDTAHSRLVLSEDRRRARWERTWQPRPSTPERFDTELCVLGREGFTSGRHYWEVEVEPWGIWAVGVARESVCRKGWVDFSPEQGVWAVQGRQGCYWALTAPGERTDLSLSHAQRLRVCLDCEGGRVALYDAGSEDPIVTFPLAPFAGERIRPIFRVGHRVSYHLLFPHSRHSPSQLILCP